MLSKIKQSWKVKDVRRKWNLKIKQQKTGKMINIPLNRELKKLIDEYTEEMKDAAKNLQFERAAELRDMINKLKD